MASTMPYDPSLTCKSGGTPVVNTTLPYCILPYGSEKMQDCCQQYGNGTVHFKEDCYYWCNLKEAVGDSDEEKEDDSSRRIDDFSSCMSKANDTDLAGMVCSLYSGHRDGDGNGDDDGNGDKDDKDDNGDKDDNDDEKSTPTPSPTSTDMPSSAVSPQVAGTASIFTAMLTLSFAMNLLF